MSCFLGENRDIYFPKLSAENDLLTFSEIAALVLEVHGFIPELCTSEEEAKEKAARMASGSKSWPCFFFKSDTTGEKLYEEFYTAVDSVNLDRYRQVGVISQLPWVDRDKINQALKAFALIRENDRWCKEEMVEAIKMIVPELEHEEKGKNLDQKM